MPLNPIYCLACRVSSSIPLCKQSFPGKHSSGAGPQPGAPSPARGTVPSLVHMGPGLASGWGARSGAGRAGAGRSPRKQWVSFGREGVGRGSGNLLLESGLQSRTCCRGPGWLGKASRAAAPAPRKGVRAGRDRGRPGVSAAAPPPRTAPNLGRDLLPPGISRTAPAAAVLVAPSTRWLQQRLQCF